ncbi:MAG: hypothetical protein ABSB70_14120 [Candidatus Velthaea sp.]
MIALEAPDVRLQDERAVVLGDANQVVPRRIGATGPGDSTLLQPIVGRAVATEASLLDGQLFAGRAQS